MRNQKLMTAVRCQSKVLCRAFFVLSALTLATYSHAQTPAVSESVAATALEGMRGRVVGGSERLGPQAMATQMHNKGMNLFEKNQAELKKQLNLSAAQEPLWESFVQSVRPVAPEGQMVNRVQMKEISQLPAPQRAQRMLELHEDLHAKKLAQMHSRLEAMKMFYAQLNTEQQKTFDQVTWRHHQERWHLRREMHRPA
jgi:hypothetical protein